MLLKAQAALALVIAAGCLTAAVVSLLSRTGVPRAEKVPSAVLLALLGISCLAAGVSLLRRSA